MSVHVEKWFDITCADDESECGEIIALGDGWHGTRNIGIECQRPHEHSGDCGANVNVHWDGQRVMLVEQRPLARPDDES